VRLKGRFIKKKEIARRENVRKANIERSKEKRAKAFEEKRQEVCSGNRIVNISVLAENLKCKKCNTRLGLDKIKSEHREGLQSTFMIECDICKLIFPVETGKYHNLDKETSKYLKDKKHNDITACAVLGNLFFTIDLYETSRFAMKLFTK